MYTADYNLQETEWAHDPNAFVAQESEESTSYSVRVAGFDLIDVIIQFFSFVARYLPFLSDTPRADSCSVTVHFTNEYRKNCGGVFTSERKWTAGLVAPARSGIGSHRRRSFNYLRFSRY